MKILSALAALLLIAPVQAETIRIAIGTQDTTISCATGGLLIRELKLLEKYLPHDGKYRDAKYDIVWKNFTSGAPLTNEMVAGKLDIGSMADFPGAANAAAFRKAGRRSVFVTVLSGSTLGSGNGIVVPRDSPVTSLAELKGQTISVAFASTAHGMLLRAVKAQGLNPDRDLNIIAQPPEVAGPALQTHKIAAHAGFVPFAELFAYRGFARKIYDGAQTQAPSFFGSLVDATYAERYPEILIAFLRAAMEAEQLIAAEPEKYSELMEKHTGIEAAVSYLYHGPLGLQTRDFTWKPEYRQALRTSLETLKLLRRTDTDLDVERVVDDRYVREAFKLSGLDYEARLKNYAKHPLQAKDALSGKPITDTRHLAEIWVRGDPLVRHYATVESAFAELRRIEAAGQSARAVYVHDQKQGLKLLAPSAYFVTEPKGQIAAFLQKGEADAYASERGGKVSDYASLHGGAAQGANLDAVSLIK